MQLEMKESLFIMKDVYEKTKTDKKKATAKEYLTGTLLFY